jgi:hypothetical protein
VIAFGKAIAAGVSLAECPPASAGWVRRFSDTKSLGVFVGGHVSKQGGATDLTFVSLDIDGRNVVNLSAARNLGFTQANPYGLVLLQSRTDNLAFGFPEPLRYERELVVSVKVSEDGVVQILANVVHGSGT